MKNIILDSWTIIAWLQGEPQGKKVRDLINWVSGDTDLEEKIKNLIGQSEIEKIRLFVNIINLGEVFYILGRRKGKEEAKDTISEIKENPIEIIPVSNSLVFTAASLKVNYPIAYADTFAIATAITQEGDLLTGDPELKGLEDIPIIWIGE